MTRFNERLKICFAKNKKFEVKDDYEYKTSIIVRIVLEISQ